MKDDRERMEKGAVPKATAWLWFKQVIDCRVHYLRRLSSCLLLFISLFLTACGFQLRGEQTLPFSALNVAGNPGYATLIQLKEAVSKVPHTRLAKGMGDADGTLIITAETRDKIITALSAAGRVREYELRLRVGFRLNDKAGTPLIPPTEIMLFRLLPYDETQVLSKGEEEVLLYRDMQNDIVSQIMRRVAAAKPKT
jgi:LPS-assembly lipoprotein